MAGLKTDPPLSPMKMDDFTHPSFLFWGLLTSKSAISFHTYDSHYPMFLGIA